MDRDAMIRFMKALIKEDRYLAVDLTPVLPMNEGIISATLGHNSIDEYLPQVQILFLFSPDHDAPAYFRILPGAINSVVSLKLSIEESGVKKIVLVADTGFYSSANMKALDSIEISYIMPLRRNSRIIDYSTQGEKPCMLQDHPIFYMKYSHNDHTIYNILERFPQSKRG